ncbi:MAG: hypothetical protein R3Y11_12460, partial [Pseudomonadota bacterium]
SGLFDTTFFIVNSGNPSTILSIGRLLLWSEMGVRMAYQFSSGCASSFYLPLSLMESRSFLLAPVFDGEPFYLPLSLMESLFTCPCL